MKKVTWIKFTLLIVFVLVSGGEAKNFDFSISAKVGYDRAEWKSGKLPSPTGTIKDSWVGVVPEIQIKYNRLFFQPTIAVSYNKRHFNFSTAQAPIQKADPELIDIHVGVTKDLRYVDAYLLAGVTMASLNPSLVEAVPYRYHGRGIDISHNYLSFKLGAYRLFAISSVKIGPEFSVQIFPESPGFSRCRKMSMSHLQPFLGMRLQY